MEYFKNQSKKKAVTFSYDDGVVQDIRLIQLLNKYNLKCTFNLNSGLLGRAGTLMCQGQRIAHYKVQPQDVKYIYDGHEVAAHTLTHPRLTELAQEEIVRQVSKDREALSELAGYDVVGMAYPCGGVNHDDRVASIIEKETGIRYCRTVTSTHSFASQSDLYKFNPTASHNMEFDKLMHLAEQFVSMDAETPQIFYIWGHSYEMDLASDRWGKLEEFFKVISNREDVFYGTNAQVLL